MKFTLLIIGLIFPLLSWTTLLLSLHQARVTGKSSSGVYIPFFGPILIDIWLLSVAAPAWTLAVPWLADIGTVLFLYVSPHLLADWWRTSCFTREFILSGGNGVQTVEISLHKGGHYQLRKRWSRTKGETGILELGEPGIFENEDSSILLTSHSGRTRHLHRHDSHFEVIDPHALDDCSIDGWKLHRLPKS